MKYDMLKNSNYTLYQVTSNSSTSNMMGDPYYRNLVPNAETYSNTSVNTFNTSPYFKPINYSKEEKLKLIKTLVIDQIPSQTKQGQVILRCICPISKTYLRFESISKLIHWIQNPYFNSSTISSTSFKIGSGYFSTTNTNFIKY